MGIVVGFVSVFSGIYTTDSVLDSAYNNPEICTFKVISTSLNFIMMLCFEQG